MAPNNPCCPKPFPNPAIIALRDADGIITLFEMQPHEADTRFSGRRCTHGLIVVEELSHSAFALTDPGGRIPAPGSSRG